MRTELFRMTHSWHVQAKHLWAFEVWQRSGEHAWRSMGSATHVVGTHDFLAEVGCIPSWHILCKSTLGGFKRIKKSKTFLDFRRKLETLFIKIELAKDFIRPKRKIAIATLKFKLSIPQRTPTQSQKRMSETCFLFLGAFCKYQKKKTQINITNESFI